MENGVYALLPLLGILALIKRVRDKWHHQSMENKLEEPKTPSFPLPDKIGAMFRDEAQHQACVWEELTRLHSNRNWRFGVFESENYVESIFHIAEDTDEYYRYLLYAQQLHFDVRVLHSFSPEITTDLFVLAAHFNKLLTFGKVVVDVNRNNVIFSYQNELTLYSVFPEKIEMDLSRHFYISKDVYWAFQKFVSDREEPVIIIGELINIQKMRQENTEEN
ncbi:MAG: hypothetical protein RL207_2018 [Bacteroidota bacterium]|jgi:hypothetical protein